MIKYNDSCYNLQYIQFVISSSDAARVRNLFANIHPADAADILEDLNIHERSTAVALLSHITLAHIWKFLEPEIKSNVLEFASLPQVKALYSMYGDEFLNDVTEDDKAALNERFENYRIPDAIYPEQSVGRIMSGSFFLLEGTCTVEESMTFLRNSQQKDIDFAYIFLANMDGVFDGAVHLGAIVTSSINKTLSEIKANVPAVHVATTCNVVADLFAKYTYQIMAVIDDENRLIGVVYADDVLSIIEDEYEDNILGLGGVHSSSIHRPILESCASRMRWLSTTIVSAVIIAFLISQSEYILSHIVALNSLITIVASFSGNAGIQAATTTISAISAQHIRAHNIFRIIMRESLIGLINGFIFGLIIGTFTSFFFASWLVGIIAVASMTINMACAGFVGAAVPLLLNRAAQNPATGAGPILTTITDISGFFIVLLCTKLAMSLCYLLFNNT